MTPEEQLIFEAGRAAGYDQGRDDAFAEAIEAARHFCGTLKHPAASEGAHRVLHSIASRSGNNGKSFAHREYHRGRSDERCGSPKNEGCGVFRCGEVLYQERVGD